MMIQSFMNANRFGNSGDERAVTGTLGCQVIDLSIFARAGLALITAVFASVTAIFLIFVFFGS